MPETFENVQRKLPDYIVRGLTQLAKEQHFTEGRYKIETEAGSEHGDGFAGEMLKVFLREGERELIVVCKKLPENEVRRQQGVPLFEQETVAYNRILPILMDFQRGKPIPEYRRFQNFPHCYYASMDVGSMESVIIMEDLRLQGYRMWDKAKPVNWDHARQLMVQLGRLHALSFAMKDQQPKQFEACTQFSDCFQKMFDADETNSFGKMMASMCDRALETLDENDTYHRDKLGKFKHSFVDEIYQCVDGPAAEPYAVIGHGDCWVNNMMFNYEADNETPKNVILIDWQLSRYGSPVLDLVYFIFNCSDEQFRARHYKKLLHIYYNSMSDHLRKLGGDAKRQFPWSAFQSQLKQFGRYGILMAMMVLPILCTPNDELPDTDETMENMMKGVEGDADSFDFGYGTTEKARENYRSRMSGAIRDAVRLGYI